MTTKFIGIKEFRQNLASCTSKVLKMQIQFIVMKKNKPVLKVQGIDEKAFSLESFVKELDDAEEQIKKGKCHTQEEIMKEFGIS